MQKKFIFIVEFQLQVLELKILFSWKLYSKIFIKKEFKNFSWTIENWSLRSNN